MDRDKKIQIAVAVTFFAGCVLMALAANAANPDFPGGERFAVEAVRDYEFNRDDPINATALTALWPAGRRATIWAGLRQDTSDLRNEAGAYATRRRLTLHLAVRVYFGGGR